VKLVEAARAFAAESKALRTRKAYRAAWEAFVSWCGQQDLQAFPAAPETVALYLTARTEYGRKVSTIELELAAISQAHKAAGAESPRAAAAVREVMRGIRRSLGVAPARRPRCSSRTSGLCSTSSRRTSLTSSPPPIRVRSRRKTLKSPLCSDSKRQPWVYAQNEGAAADLVCKPTSSESKRLARLTPRTALLVQRG
jgi:hypothetical protein